MVVLLEEKAIQAVNNFPPLLQSICDERGLDSAQVWQWGLASVRSEIISDLMVILLTIIAVYISYRILKWGNDDSTDILDKYTGWAIFGSAISFAASFVLIIISCTIIVNLPDLILNPEYNAMVKIIEGAAKFDPIYLKNI